VDNSCLKPVYVRMCMRLYGLSVLCCCSILILSCYLSVN